MHHIEHVGGEAEAIAKLLYGDTCADDHEVVGQADAQIDKRGAGQRHAGRHGPQGFLESPPRGCDAADDAAHGERDDTDGAVDNAYGVGVEGQAARCCRAEQEGIDHLQQKGLGQTVEQHEHDGEPHTGLMEVGVEGMVELAQHVTECLGLAVCRAQHVSSRLGKCEGVVEGDGGEQCGSDAHGHLPRQRYVARALL